MSRGLPIFIFLLTFIPLGLGHTLYGTMAAVLLATVIGLSLSLFLMIAVLSYAGEKRFFIRYILAPVKKLFFASSERIFVCAVFVVFFCAAFSISYFSNGCVPAIQDSVAQLIHARMLAAGHVTLPAYPMGEFFNLGVMVNDTRYYSQYAPGHIFILMLGLVLGAPCAVNPLLGALTCVVVFHLAKILYRPQTARVATLLCLTSPFMLQMSAEFMNHATTLLFTTVFLLAFIKAVQKPAYGWALIAGIAIAYVGITRPLTALGVALPAIFYASYLLLASPRHYFLRFACMGFGAILPVAVLFWFNAATTGDMLTLGYGKLATNRLGFGPVPESMLQWVSQPDHTLWHGIGMAFNNLNALHWFLFCWPTSSLLFVLPAFVRRKMQTPEWLLLATCFSLLAAYVPYYFQGWSVGPRFLYEIIGILIIFTACGIMRVPELFQAVRPARLDFVLACCVLFSAGFTLNGFYSDTGRAEKLLAARTLESRLLRPTLLFMPFDTEYWRLAGIYYPVRGDSRIIVAVDKGAGNRKLMALYPGYEAYRASNIGTDKELWEAIR